MVQVSMMNINTIKTGLQSTVMCGSLQSDVTLPELTDVIIFIITELACRPQPNKLDPESTFGLWRVHYNNVQSTLCRRYPSSSKVSRGNGWARQTW